MTEELRVISDEFRRQGNIKAADFIGEAIQIGRNAGILPDSLGLTIMDQEGEYLLGLEDDILERPTAINFSSFDYDTKFGKLKLNDGQIVDLTITENEMFFALAELPNKILSHEKLCERVWGEENQNTRASLKTTISNLRRKLLIAFGDSNGMIRNKRGLGYMFCIEEKTE